MTEDQQVLHRVIYAVRPGQSWRCYLKPAFSPFHAIQKVRERYPEAVILSSKPLST